MNKDIIQGNWQQIKGKVCQTWGNLTDSDVAKMKGTRQELCGALQEKYGYQKDKVEKEIDAFIAKHHLH